MSPRASTRSNSPRRRQWRERPRQWRQPPARSVYPGAVAHRDVGRRLRRPDRQHPEPVADVYGTPGEDGTLETPSAIHRRGAGAVGKLRLELAQSSLLSAAQSLAQQLNATTQGIQTLRSNIEQDIGVSVGQANVAINQIAQLNSRLQSMNATIRPRRH